MTTTLEQLINFMRGPIFDGDLISKTARDNLENAGLIVREGGYQTLTAKGIQYLRDLGYLGQ